MPVELRPMRADDWPAVERIDAAGIDAGDAGVVEHSVYVDPAASGRDVLVLERRSSVVD